MQLLSSLRSSPGELDATHLGLGSHVAWCVVPAVARDGMVLHYEQVRTLRNWLAQRQGKRVEERVEEDPG